LTHENLSERLGKDRSTITNFLRLLKLPPEIQASIKIKALSMGHARALAGVENPMLQIEIYKLVIKDSLSVRKTEELCRLADTKKTNKTTAKPVAASPNNDTKRLIQNLTNHLSTKVEITTRKDDRGEIVIQFFSKDDLERLVELIEGV
jgi:ParB family chromosome partitioning protein